MKSDKYLALVVFFQMIAVTIQLLIPLLGIASIEQAADYRVLITLLSYLPGIIIVLKRNMTMLVMTFLAYFMILFFNYLLFPTSHPFIESSAVYSLTPISLLTALFIVSIRDMSIFSKMLLYVSRASLVIAFAYVVAYNISPFKDLDVTYSMSFGYSMLLPAMFLFSQLNIWDKVASLLFLVLIFLGGSRGPVLVLVLFYATHLVFFGSAKEWKKIIPFVIIAGIALALVLPKYIDLESSRTFRLLESGEMISHDSGREENVYAKIRPRIMEQPITGWGIGADRYFMDGSYSHNVFLEVFLHYGIILGTILFAAFFMWCLMLFKSKRLRFMNRGRELFVMFFLYGFVPLLVSGSYLIDFRVGVMMGFLLRIGNKRMNRRQLVCI